MSKDLPILIVDDEPDIVDTICDIFGLYGFETLKANSGLEALKVLESTSVGVVVSDIRMPNGDGISLLKSIREKDFAKPVVLFISGFSDYTIDALFELGVDGFFAKPFDAMAVADAIRSSIIPRKLRWAQPVVPTVKDPLIQIEKPSRLGRGGVFVPCSSQGRKEGSMIHFELVDDSKTSIRGEGVVRWIRNSGSTLPEGVGVEFKYLDKESLAHVSNWIENSQPRAFVPKQ